MSASNPEPLPSTVLISVNISLAVWSAVAPSSTFIIVRTSAAVSSFVTAFPLSFPTILFDVITSSFDKDIAAFEATLEFETDVKNPAPFVSWFVLLTLVAPAAMPSSFEPSLATSRPSTVPDTEILPVIEIPEVFIASLVVPAGLMFIVSLPAKFILVLSSASPFMLSRAIE